MAASDTAHVDQHASSSEMDVDEDKIELQEMSTTIEYHTKDPQPSSAITKEQQQQEEEHQKEDAQVDCRWLSLGLGFITFIFFGLCSVCWILSCLLICLPCSLQLMKIAKFLLFNVKKSKPYRKYKSIEERSIGFIKDQMFMREKTSLLMILSNFVWFCMFGWFIASIELICIVILYLSVIGRDNAKRHVALLSLLAFPFGVFLKY